MARFFTCTVNLLHADGGKPHGSTHGSTHARTTVIRKCDFHKFLFETFVVLEFSNFKHIFGNNEEV